MTPEVPGGAGGGGDAMAALVRASLAALEDVEGVTGSFVLTRAGRVVARELPPMFDDFALQEASGRLARLRETFAAIGDELDMAVLRFGEHKLYLKAMTGGMLCIVAGTAINLPAMRMAANLVGRRIAGALAAEAEAETEAELLAPIVAAAPPRPAPESRPPGWAPPGMRRFRGRPVGE